MKREVWIMRTRFRNERGAALLETAITVPIILLICVGIFEFGRAYQVQQVLTNAVREGARAAVIEGTSDTQVAKIVTDYMNSGKLPVDIKNPPTVAISRNEPFGSTTGSKVTVTFPYKFMVIGGVVKLVAPKSTLGSANLNMQASALMRNE
jgi:Flp pilus assembly protein TadG